MYMLSVFFLPTPYPSHTVWWCATFHYNTYIVITTAVDFCFCFGYFILCIINYLLIIQNLTGIVIINAHYFCSTYLTSHLTRGRIICTENDNNSSWSGGGGENIYISLSLCQLHIYIFWFVIFVSKYMRRFDKPAVIIHNEPYSVYSVRVYLDVRCSINRGVIFPKTTLAFGGCIRASQSAIL